MDADTRPALSDPGGITVGALPDGRLLIDRHQMHVRVTGPTGAGKTASFFMPTLMRSWKGSAIVHDRKGDFWLLLQGSSRWRHNLLFAPTLPDSVKYNPMARVGTGTDQIAGFQNLAALLPHTDTAQAKEPVFIAWLAWQSRVLSAGIISAVPQLSSQAVTRGVGNVVRSVTGAGSMVERGRSLAQREVTHMASTGRGIGHGAQRVATGAKRAAAALSTSQYWSRVRAASQSKRS